MKVKKKLREERTFIAYNKKIKLNIVQFKLSSTEFYFSKFYYLNLVDGN